MIIKGIMLKIKFVVRNLDMAAYRYNITYLKFIKITFWYYLSRFLLGLILHYTSYYNTKLHNYSKG